MSMVEAVKSVFSKYATFSGRARRAEYWWFYLAVMILNAILLAVVMPNALSSIDPTTGEIGAGYFGAMLPVSIVGLALFLPRLAVTVRRLHDTDRSGLWYFIAFVPLAGPIILIVFLATEGTAGANQYGPDPKAAAA